MSQCVTLELLYREGRMTGRELAHGLGLDTSTVSRVVNVLMRDGMVRRTRDEAGDRRYVFVSLSARGRALAAKLQSCADTYCERIWGRIPEDRREDVVYALRVLVDAIDDLPAM
ncbi:MAG: MarR family transcriptional regulator [Deltaproteobacteria bacterium]|nr:MarR family transcriptional regulator [Deltaproteobacteria bacterium]